MLTRSRSELRARLNQAPALRSIDGGKSSKETAEPGAPGGMAPLTALAPHIDRTVKLDFTFLIRQAQQLDAPRIQKLMKVAEKGVPHRADADLVRRLTGLEADDTAMVPFHALRPGQAQLSFTHAGTKVAKFLKKLDGHTPEDLTHLSADLGLLEVPCVIGPGGRFAIIHDRHHHMSGLLALMGWTHNLTNDGHALHMGTPGPEIATLQALFGGTPAVQIKVSENLSHLSEAAFLEAAEPYLHPEDAKGAVVVLPTRFADLDGNPFRFLAAQTKIKVERTGDGKRDFTLEAKAPDSAVWIKPPSAPDFVEFYVGKVFRSAFAAAGRTYDPKVALSPDDVDMLRAALSDVRENPEHPSHEVLQSVVIKPADVSVEDFKDDIKVGRKKGHVRLK